MKNIARSKGRKSTTVHNCILIIVDNPPIIRLFQHYAKTEIDEYIIYYSSTLEEAKKLYQLQKENIFIIFVDLSLADRPEGEAVRYCLTQDTPVVLIATEAQEELREKYLKLGAIDYIVKENHYSYHYATSLIKRLEKNKGIEVLVVDQNKGHRRFIKQLLKKQLFKVITAEDGAEAIDILTSHPEIKILLTCFDMPNMNGFELIEKIRREHNNLDLPIIGLSEANGTTMSARFIKMGANDFLNKPIIHEELYCRIRQNLEHLEHITYIRALIFYDPLTGLYNRRFLFEKGPLLFKEMHQENEALSVAVLDIDHFKRINDVYGHESGDSALVFIAELFKHNLSKYTVIRMGGEEFCVLMPHLENRLAVKLIEAFCNLVNRSLVNIGIDEIHVHLSGGVSTTRQSSLDAQINHADELLYQAKKAGRNRIFGEGYTANSIRPQSAR